MAESDKTRPSLNILSALFDTIYYSATFAYCKIRVLIALVSRFYQIGPYGPFEAHNWVNMQTPLFSQD